MRIYNRTKNPKQNKHWMMLQQSLRRSLDGRQLYDEFARLHALALTDLDRYRGY